MTRGFRYTGRGETGFVRKAPMGTSRGVPFPEIRCGTIQNLAAGLEARTMTRAVPAAFHGIPQNNAPQVRAHCGTFMQLACVIPINRDLRDSSPNDRAHAWLDFIGRPHFARSHPCGILPGNISRPKIQSLEKHARDRAMSEPCSRIACSDIYIGLVSGVSADECQPI
jgi:hypothetical protein